VALLVIASSEPRIGRSLVAAAIAYRLARDGRSVSLVRMAGDDGADRDASVFAGLEGVRAPQQSVPEASLNSIGGDVVAEAPPGAVDTILSKHAGARAIVVAEPQSSHLAVPAVASFGTIVTHMSAGEAGVVAQRSGVLAALPEDDVLAAPSASDIADVIKATWLAKPDESVSVGQVMIGTVASDAAAPYFANRRSTCIVTRFDKTDIQLAALNTDIECLVLTGGGEPSPYLLDRIAGHRPDVAVLLTEDSTVDAVRSMEPLFGSSPFDGQAKLRRAVELLDAAGLVVDF
jgi:BioD-like phosphotransacetylase family protein